MEEKKNNDGLIKILCYVGIFVLLLFIVLPPLFWNLFPEENNNNNGNNSNDTNQSLKTIMNLNCVKEEDFVDYKLKTTINTNYVEGKISDSTFTYEIEYTNELFASEDLIIEEYEKLKRINNVDFDEYDNMYILTIDYLNFDYSNEEALANHRNMIAPQMQYYSGEEHFECKTTKVQ